MKKLIYVVTVLVALGTSVISCHSDDDNYVLTSDCYISSFKLGAVKRTVHTTSSTGADSTYTTSTSASTFRMAIDQREGTITNVDLLPMGSQLDKVPVTITAQGTVVYASVSDTTTWTTYSSKDTLDFTQPVLIRVLANDGKGYRDYTATLKARENNADGYTWQRLEDINEMKDMTSARLLLHVTTGIDAGTYPMLFTSDAEGQCYFGEVTRESTGPFTVRTFTPCEGLEADCDVTTVVSYRNHLWMTSATGKLFSAEGPYRWREVVQPEALHLVAASTTALYGVARTDDGYTMASSVDGTTWTPMSVEGSGFEKPLVGLAYTQTNGNHRVLMLADAYTDSENAPLFVWNLLEGHDEAWLPFNDEYTDNTLPRWQQPIVVSYNNWLVAMGCNDLSGRERSLVNLYISHDNGINWKKDSYLSTPSEMRGTAGPVAALAWDKYIWIIAGKQQWTVSYNSYGEGQ